MNGSPSNRSSSRRFGRGKIIRSAISSRIPPPQARAEGPAPEGNASATRTGWPPDRSSAARYAEGSIGRGELQIHEHAGEVVSDRAERRELCGEVELEQDAAQPRVVVVERADA